MVRELRGMLLAVAGLLAVSCDGGREPVVVEGVAMGTTWRVTIADDDGAKAEEIRMVVGALLEELEGKFSHWRADSEVSRLNAAGAGESVEVSEETRQLIARADTIRDASGGAFDVRVGREVAARGFGPELSREGSGAVDLSGIAKGYAVDRVVSLLGDLGVENCLVEIGGELRARGVNGRGKAWAVGVEAPEPGARAIHLVVHLEDEAIASSGNYRLYRETDEGGIVSHLVDPRGDEEKEDAFRAVSVIAEDATAADAWATAMFVLGEEEGMKLAEERGMAVCFLRREESGEIVESMSEGFRERIRADE